MAKLLCKSVILIALMAMTSPLLRAQVAVHAQLDSADIMIGDQVGLTLFINHEPGVEIDRIDWGPLDQVKEIEVVNYGNLNTVAEENEVLLEQRLTITSFDSGYYFIPKIPVFYKKNGETGVARTDELALSVNTITAQSDSTQLAPIKDIVREPLKFVDFLPYIGGLAGIGLIIFLIYFLSNRKSKRKAPTQPEIVLPPHEIALKKLDELKRAKLWQQGEIKQFQSELTFIIREYLENRFQVPALESTTNEIARLFKTIELDEDWKTKLLSIFRTADMVKFAKAVPDVKVHDEGLQTAERFVIDTKKKPEPVEAEEPNNETDKKGESEETTSIQEEQEDPLTKTEPKEE